MKLWIIEIGYQQFGFVSLYDVSSVLNLLQNAVPVAGYPLVVETNRREINEVCCREVIEDVAVDTAQSQLETTSSTEVPF